MKQDYVKIKLNKPKNLSLEDIIQDDLPYFIRVRKENGESTWSQYWGKKIKRNYQSDLYYFIHILLERQQTTNNSLRYRYDREFVRLHSRDIEPVRSKNYFKTIWSILNHLKVIDWRFLNEPNIYRQSAMAYYFDFHDKFRGQEIVEHEVLVKRKIVEKMFQKNTDCSISVSKQVDYNTIEVQKQSLHQFNSLHNIIFDFDRAKEFIEGEYRTGRIDLKKYNSCLMDINNLSNGRYIFKISKKCNRITTNVTMMSSILRQFILDNNGKELVELDFSSFNAFALYKIIDSINTQEFPKAERIAIENEVDLYRRLLSGGDFYNDLKDIVFPDEELGKDEIKKIVLVKWLNGRVNSRDKHRKQLKKRFPMITQLVDLLKEDDYSNFSNQMMKMESELINDIIYSKFIQDYPEATLFTIFDGIMVDKIHAIKMHSFMLEEGSKYFGINCVVKAK